MHTPYGCSFESTRLILSFEDGAYLPIDGRNELSSMFLCFSYVDASILVDLVFLLLLKACVKGGVIFQYGVI
jgi:hypothetical protein